MRPTDNSVRTLKQTSITIDHKSQTRVRQAAEQRERSIDALIDAAILDSLRKGPKTKAES